MNYSKILLTVLSGIALGFAIKKTTTDKTVPQEIVPSHDYADGSEHPDAFGDGIAADDDTDYPMFI